MYQTGLLTLQIQRGMASSIFTILLVFVFLGPTTGFSQSPPPFEWPEGARAAVSLTFDDARHSQVDKGTALLNRFDVKATFYVVPGAVEERLEGWKAAVAAGHEIANHSLVHPCSGNFLWSRDRALERYTLEAMRNELVQANARLNELLGVRPVSFAYPCGQKFIGRGRQTTSYVPLVAELFTSGRGWLDEAASDPAYVDLAQLTGIEMDGKTFEEVVVLLDQAKADGLWIVLSGHERDTDGRQTTRLGMLEKLIPYLQDPANGFWLGTVEEIADFVVANRTL